MDNIGTLLDFVVLIGCASCIHSWWWMRRNNKIRNNPLFIPSNASLKDCKDKEGYLQYLLPRLLVFSVIGTVLSAVNLYGNFNNLPGFITLSAIAALLIDLAWFSIVVWKSQRQFWSTAPAPKPLE